MTSKEKEELLRLLNRFEQRYTLAAKYLKYQTQHLESMAKDLLFVIEYYALNGKQEEPLEEYDENGQIIKITYNRNNCD